MEAPMKKLLCLLMVLMLILPATAMAADTPITSTATGYWDVPFSNGYRGFCLDVNLHGATSGNSFTVAGDTSAATSNRDGSDISQQLKILFTQCFEDIFEANGSGGYRIKDSNTIQAVVWSYSDGQHIWGTQKELANAVAAYSGPAIPDNGYTRTLSNGDTITFYFAVMAPVDETVQHFFAYNFTVTPAGEHEHSFGTTWESDDTQHWYECDCGEKSDVTPHTPTVINDKPAAEFEAGYTGDTVCSVCNELMATGTSIPATHQHNFGTDWESDGIQHWHECGCGEKSDVTPHTSTVINSKPATETEEGYTGDTVCSVCEKLLEKGQAIPKTHQHSFGTSWKTSATQHWHECACGTKQDTANHVYKDGYCTSCNYYNPNYTADNPTTGDSFVPAHYFALCLMSLASIAWICNFAKKKGIF